MVGLFERLHEQVHGGSWLGCVTGSEYAKAEDHPRSHRRSAPRNAAAYGIAPDAHGETTWGRSNIGSGPIVVSLVTAVSPR
jgi:hypothetical protein